MKRVLLVALMCAFAMPILAQQEDVVVRRGQYKAAVTDTIKETKPPKKHGDWYSQFSVGLTAGTFLQQRVHSYNVGDIRLNSDRYSDGGALMTFGYERLKRNGDVMYGPGFHFKVGCGGAADAFLHGRWNIDANLLGFKKMRPFIGVSLGLSYWFESIIHYQDVYEYRVDRSYYSYSYHYYAEGGSLDGWRYVDFDGVKPYFDLKAGLSISTGRYSALNIGYCASLMPYAKSTIWLSNYQRDINNEINSHNTGYHTLDLGKPDKSLKIYHGLEVSFRF
ncbi:MAG: hypothetical protein K5864_00540 [Bacteroidales bacterium]|nr:hypothetical protein [Bacteroidales bacterium]